MISIKNISFSYGQHKVFENLSMELHRGKIYGLLGENGVGKSTLLKVISGLLKLNIGECLVNGEIPITRNISFLQDMFYIPEDFMGESIVVENYAAGIGRFYPNFSIDKFHKILKDFCINPKSILSKLSLGQQKKTIIALALALQTKILLMDEPSNGLDIPSKAQLRNAISENSFDGQLILISTHQVKDIENLIDSVIIMSKEGVLLKAEIDDITRLLSFNIESTEDLEALYSQKDSRGFLNVKRNIDSIETSIDLEALFNCAIMNKDLFKSLFDSKK